MKPYLSIGGINMSENLNDLTMKIPCHFLDTTTDNKAGTIIGLECPTAEVFVKTLKKINKHCGLNLFRGQADSTWPLLPAAHRKNSWIGEFAKANLAEGCKKLIQYKWENESEENFERRVELALRNYFQTYTINSYQQTAREWGIGSYDPSNFNRNITSEVDITYNPIIRYLEHDKIPWLQNTNNIHILIEAQHHGIDTPLLDFTSSYEVAVDFATRDKCGDTGTHIIVWGIVTSPPFYFCHRYDRRTPYFQTQKSFMLANSAADITYYELREWIPFERRLSNTMPLGSVFEVILPYSEVESLRSYLDISYESLYMMGTPMFESIKDVQNQIDSKRDQFRCEVQSRIASQIDWDEVPVDKNRKPIKGTERAEYCKVLCNEHCNTMFSTTFK